MFPEHTDTVMAIATIRQVRAMRVMADVDEECHITEIRSAVEVDERAVPVSAGDAS